MFFFRFQYELKVSAFGHDPSGRVNPGYALLPCLGTPLRTSPPSIPLMQLFLYILSIRTVVVSMTRRKR